MLAFCIYKKVCAFNCSGSSRLRRSVPKNYTCTFSQLKHIINLLTGSPGLLTLVAMVTSHHSNVSLFSSVVIWFHKIP